MSSLKRAVIAAALFHGAVGFAPVQKKAGQPAPIHVFGRKVTNGGGNGISLANGNGHENGERKVSKEHLQKARRNLVEISRERIRRGTLSLGEFFLEADYIDALEKGEAFDLKEAKKSYGKDVETFVKAAEGGADIRDALGEVRKLYRDVPGEGGFADTVLDKSGTGDQKRRILFSIAYDSQKADRDKIRLATLRDENQYTELHPILVEGGKTHSLIYEAEVAGNMTTRSAEEIVEDYAKKYGIGVPLDNKTKGMAAGALGAAGLVVAASPLLARRRRRILEEVLEETEDFDQSRRELKAYAEAQLRQGRLELGEFLIEAAHIDSRERGKPFDIEKAKERYYGYLENIHQRMFEGEELPVAISKAVRRVNYSGIKTSIDRVLLQGMGNCEALGHFVGALAYDAGEKNVMFVSYKNHLPPVICRNGKRYDLTSGGEAYPGGVEFRADELVSMYLCPPIPASSLIPAEEAPQRRWWSFWWPRWSLGRMFRLFGLFGGYGRPRWAERSPFGYPQSNDGGPGSSPLFGFGAVRPFMWGRKVGEYGKLALALDRAAKLGLLTMAAVTLVNSLLVTKYEKKEAEWRQQEMQEMSEEDPYRTSQKEPSRDLPFGRAHPFSFDWHWPQVDWEYPKAVIKMGDSAGFITEIGQPNRAKYRLPHSNPYYYLRDRDETFIKTEYSFERFSHAFTEVPCLERTEDKKSVPGSGLVEIQYEPDKKETQECSARDYHLWHSRDAAVDLDRYRRIYHAQKWTEFERVIALAEVVKRHSYAIHWYKSACWFRRAEREEKSMAAYVEEAERMIAGWDHKKEKRFWDSLREKSPKMWRFINMDLIFLGRKGDELLLRAAKEEGNEHLVAVLMGKQATQERAIALYDGLSTDRRFIVNQWMRNFAVRTDLKGKKRGKTLHHKSLDIVEYNPPTGAERQVCKDHRGIELVLFYVELYEKRSKKYTQVPGAEKGKSICNALKEGVEKGNAVMGLDARWDAPLFLAGLDNFWNAFSYPAVTSRLFRTRYGLLRDVGPGLSCRDRSDKFCQEKMYNSCSERREFVEWLVQWADTQESLRGWRTVEDSWRTEGSSRWTARKLYEQLNEPLDCDPKWKPNFGEFTEEELLARHHSLFIGSDTD